MIALGLENRRAEQERTMLLENAEKARTEAEAANRAKDEFLATVSHELRTPLNAISGWAHMLRSGVLSPEKSLRALQTIERNAKAQTQLIDDLLDVSRIISGKLRLEMASVDMVNVVEMAIESVRPAADNKNVFLAAHFETDACSVTGDGARLQQIVWNLLTNAVKFTPKGGNVSVHLRRVRSNVEVSVEDTGQGISAEFLPHVFDRFRQADASPTRTHGGLGLGLAIVRHLVELHGGSVEAHSDGMGRGARFVVTVPVTRKRHDRGFSLANPSNDSFLGQEELDGLRILVVDDDPDALDLMISVLERYRAQVTTASDGAQALKILKATLPDVLVSDIGMPGQDGLSLIRKVRALPPSEGGRIPAVALTAYARMEDRTTAMLAGFNMHVPKPIEPTELLIVLANLAGRLASS